MEQRFPFGGGAFTLIELLVVIAIIAVLTSMFMPGLARTKNRAQQTRCLHNEQQIGLAYQMYADDNAEDYPLQPDWHGAGGASGTYVLFVAATNRPLNCYTQTYELWHCPADKGDSLHAPSINNCFLVYGNSYLVEWAQDAFRTRRVAGDLLAPRDSYAGTPIKTSEIAAGPAHKILQGDWPWHANRGNSDRRSIWHNYKGQSRFNMLFGDGHVQFYDFPVKLKDWTSDPKPSLDWLWW